MEPQGIAPYTKSPIQVQRAPNTAREVLGIVFRNRRVVLFTFLATFVGVVAAGVDFDIAEEACEQVGRVDRHGLRLQGHWRKGETVVRLGSILRIP